MGTVRLGGDRRVGASYETSPPSPALPEACNCLARVAAPSQAREKLPIRQFPPGQAAGCFKVRAGLKPHAAQATKQAAHIPRGPGWAACGQPNTP